MQSIDSFLQFPNLFRVASPGIRDQAQRGFIERSILVVEGPFLHHLGLLELRRILHGLRHLARFGKPFHATLAYLPTETLFGSDVADFVQRTCGQAM